MPTYKYHCSQCDYGFQIVQSIKADALQSCPECEGDTLQRVFHAVMVLTKGEPKTLAQQADRNEKAWGRQELAERRHLHDEAGKKGRPKAERPWWRKTDKVDTELATLAPEVTVEGGKITKSEPLSAKATEYIMTGNK